MSELFDKSIRTLELPRVLQLLADQAVSEEAKALALAVRPETDYEDVLRLLEENGVSREEVVKVNIFTTKSSYNNEITRAYSEYFKESRPCCTWIGIKELNRPTQLVEIEMQAIVGARA